MLHTMSEMPAVRDRAAEMFRTKSYSWQQAGLAAQLRQEAAEQAKRARRELLILAPLFAGVVVLYAYRDDIKGYSLHIRIAAVILLLILGWAIARALGRAVGPLLFRRMDPATAGTVGLPRPPRCGDRGPALRAVDRGPQTPDPAGRVGASPP